MTAYYNENEPFAAAWLRRLIANNLIAPGDVDDRDIKDVRPDDLRGYTQCHFFAGVGAWSYALRLAGWPDDRPVWTGSCPCQPFSAAGRRDGFADERHLWPAWHHLIWQRRPSIVFGEQVASPDGRAWFDLVHADLEGSGYAIGAAVLPAAGVGAPHGRHRLWFVADTEGRGRERPRQHEPGDGHRSGELARPRAPSRLADAGRQGRREVGAEPGGGGGRGDKEGVEQRPRHRSVRGVGYALGSGLEGQPRHGRAATGRQDQARSTTQTGGAWADARWLECRDDKSRPAEPGTFPLAYGAAARVGRLRAYGNAIVPQVAAEFIAAYEQARGREATTLRDLLW